MVNKLPEGSKVKTSGRATGKDRDSFEGTNQSKITGRPGTKSRGETGSARVRPIGRPTEQTVCVRNAPLKVGPKMRIKGDVPFKLSIPSRTRDWLICLNQNNPNLLRVEIR